MNRQFSLLHGNGGLPGFRMSSQGGVVRPKNVKKSVTWRKLLLQRRKPAYFLAICGTEFVTFIAFFMRNVITACIFPLEVSGYAHELGHPAHFGRWPWSEIRQPPLGD